MLSIVIPAYNEEKTVKSVVEEAHEVAKKISENFEILVLNDGSTDGTLEILQQINSPNLIVLKHDINKGIGASLKTLYETAQNEYIFMNAADKDIDMNVLEKFYLELKNHDADIVIGNRIYKNYSVLRKFISFLYNFLVKIFTGYDLHDAGTVKLFKKSVFQNFNPISSSVFIDAERLIYALSNGAKLIKVDIVQNTNERNNKVNFKQIIFAAKDLVILSKQMRKNKL